jgi:hypothetical protein
MGGFVFRAMDKIGSLHLNAIGRVLKVALQGMQRRAGFHSRPGSSKDQAGNL